jgi:hypothetical protein
MTILCNNVLEKMGVIAKLDGVIVKMDGVIMIFNGHSRQFSKYSHRPNDEFSMTNKKTHGQKFSRADKISHGRTKILTDGQKFSQTDKNSHSDQEFLTRPTQKPKELIEAPIGRLIFLAQLTSKWP